MEDKQKKDLNFEEAVTNLENIVKDLEMENISLEEAMEKFEEGIKLSSFCLKKLNDAEKKVEELTRSEDGKLITKSLDRDGK
ncbi:MAG: exodeoxyribonuclease VII small subunit [Candidatus Humimicrobiaceae bacterium]